MANCTESPTHPSSYLAFVEKTRLNPLSLELTSPLDSALSTSVVHYHSELVERECVSRDTRTVGHLTITRAIAYLCDVVVAAVFSWLFWRIGAHLISFFISIHFFRYSSSVRKM
jgi:hypothetical protein